jgi:hypothetical protein
VARIGRVDRRSPGHGRVLSASVDQYDAGGARLVGAGGPPSSGRAARPVEPVARAVGDGPGSRTRRHRRRGVRGTCAGRWLRAGRVERYDRARTDQRRRHDDGSPAIRLGQPGPRGRLHGRARAVVDVRRPGARGQRHAEPRRSHGPERSADDQWRRPRHDRGHAMGLRLQVRRWEGQMRGPASDPTYNALMLLRPDAEDFPVGGEIDFVEMLDHTRREVDAFVHYGADNRQVNGKVRIDATQWHNWAVEWTPAGITTYVDGQPWWSTTDTAVLPPRSMHLCLQLDWFPGGGGTAVTPSQMFVDWVAFYPLPGGIPVPPGPVTPGPTSPTPSTPPTTPATTQPSTAATTPPAAPPTTAPTTTAPTTAPSPTAPSPTAAAPAPTRSAGPNPAPSTTTASQPARSATPRPASTTTPAPSPAATPTQPPMTSSASPRPPRPADSRPASSSEIRNQPGIEAWREGPVDSPGPFRMLAPAPSAPFPCQHLLASAARFRAPHRSRRQAGEQLRRRLSSCHHALASDMST